MKHIHYKSIDSTQKECWREYEKGTKEILVSASIQTNGIGTHGRNWYTDKPNNIAFSILFTPNTYISNLDNLTIKTAKIIQKIFRNYECNLDIKEPNDLMINNKKVGGILLQTKLEKNIVKALVIGIGINISQKKFNKDIENIATSIINEFSIEIDINKFVNEFILEFKKELERRNII